MLSGLAWLTYEPIYPLACLPACFPACLTDIHSFVHSFFFPAFIPTQTDIPTYYHAQINRHAQLHTCIHAKSHTSISQAFAHAYKYTTSAAKLLNKMPLGGESEIYTKCRKYAMVSSSNTATQQWALAVLFLICMMCSQADDQRLSSKQRTTSIVSGRIAEDNYVCIIACCRAASWASVSETAACSRRRFVCLFITRLQTNGSLKLKQQHRRTPKC